MKRAWTLLTLFFLLSIATFAQDTPGTVKFPAGVDSPDSLFRAANNASTTLSSSISSTATSFTVVDASSLPPSGSLQIGGGEIVYYTSKSGNLILGVLRHQEGMTAAAYSAGTSVRSGVLASHHNTLAAAIIALENKIGTGTGSFLVTSQARATIVGTTAATMSNPRDVAVVGKIAFVTNFGANQINLYDVSKPSAPTLISTISDADLNAPRQTAIQGKYLYVSNQSGNSYTVFDITNPKSPSKLVTKSGGSIASPGGIYVRGKYLYLTGTQTGSQFTIFDNTSPSAPIELGSYTPPSGEKFGRCSFQSKYAYCPLQGTSPFADDGLYVIDISNSASPSLTGRYLVNGVGTTGAPVDSSILGQTVYELDEGGGMRIIDVTNPAAPAQIGYTTAGLGGGSTGLWAQGKFVYVSSQINNTVVAYDVSDPSNITIAATSAATLNVPSKLTVVGRYLYVVNRIGNTMSIVDLGQDDVAQLKAGAVQADYISATNGLRAGYGTIDGDLFIGRTAQIGDNLSVNGNVAINGAITSGAWNGSAIGDAFISSAATWNAKQPAGNYITAVTGDVSAAGPGSVAATVNTVGGSTAANVNAATVLANAATNANTLNAIVKRDGSGNFSAGTITASLTGLASLNELPLTFSSGLTRSTNAISLNTTQNITKLSGLTTNGPLYTSGGDGTLNSEAQLSASRGGSGVNNSNTLNFGAGGTLGSNAFTSTAYVPQTTTVNGKALSGNINLGLASSDFANQGTTTTLLHGNAAGNPSFAQVVNADIANSTIDLTAKVTGVLPVANGGSGTTVTRVTTQFDKTTDTTLANVTGLSATVIAGRTYTFKAVIFVTYDATGVGKVSIAGTATATAISYDGYASRTTAAATLSLGYTSALGTSVSVVTVTVKTIIIEGTITVNAGGTLTVQFAQNVSSGTSSVLVGSSFTVRDTGS